MTLRGQTDGMRLRRCGSKWWEFLILDVECLIFDWRRAPATGGGIGIFNFECFPAVAGRAYAWIFD